MNETEVRAYFTENASSWLQDAYHTQDYNYMTPVHRMRVVMNFLKNNEQIASVLEIGCGGGNLSVAMAEAGLQVTAVDASPQMLAHAKEHIEAQPLAVQDKISMVHGAIGELAVSSHDAATAMGLIGYLSSDAELFAILREAVTPGGVAIISFRNRLFNLFSISERTVAEATKGDLPKLVAEAAALYTPVSGWESLEFVRQLYACCGVLLENLEQTEMDDAKNPPLQQTPYTKTIEPRQTSPQEAIQVASEYGFEPIKLAGIHPHFCVPGLNGCLPAGVYNTLSDSLLPLENHPMALLWSSVFIGFFKRST